ncbi:hypothetical protein [Planctomyces sp. SH-PL14]|uniref:hypothetical protein n=1 Tax=Planctomyces sp. SH-PL14 TaxID=1632864 RepID=UPI0012E74AE0|nr:hypothetical protein [Planctomyces sp. SH-PL14]
MVVAERASGISSARGLAADGGAWKASVFLKAARTSRYVAGLWIFTGDGSGFC